MKLVLAPDAIVRQQGGGFVLHTAAAKAPFRTGNPRLVAWVLQFARAQTVDALGAATAPDERAHAQQTMAQLRAAGILIEVEAHHAIAPDDDSGVAGPMATAVLAPDDASAEVAHTQRQLARLMDETSALDADVRALGPHAASALAQHDTAGLGARVDATLAGIAALRQELAGLRVAHLERQLAGQRGEWPAGEINLHVGCGDTLLPGWVNLDLHPAPLAWNVRWGLPCGDGSVRHLYAAHLLEHLFYPREAGAFLRECRRVLRADGVLRIVVPDIAQYIAAYGKGDAAFFASRRETWHWWPADATPLEHFLGYAGVGPDPLWLADAHKFGYDFETLAKLLRQSGFTTVTRSGFDASEHAALRVDGASTYARARHANGHYSLFVEASAA
jgi:hypothetical protein